MIDSENKIIENKNLNVHTIGLNDKVLEALSIPLNSSRISDEGIHLYLETPNGQSYELNSSEIAESENHIELPTTKYNKLSSQLQDFKNIKIYNKIYTFDN